MTSARLKYLLSPWFIGALSILICNDLWWKYAYANALTGKLSDFSGILVLGLLFNYFSDRNRTLNALFVIVFFTFWKSPMSEGLIVAWNSLPVFAIGRVVDYTDLWALVLIPVVSHLPFKDRKTPQPILVPTLLGITFFALTATSRMPPDHLAYWSGGTRREIVEFETKLAPDSILSLAATHLHMNRLEDDTVWIDGQMHRLYVYTGAMAPNRWSEIDTCKFSIDLLKKKVLVRVIQLNLKPGINMIDFPESDFWRYGFKIRKTKRVYHYIHIGPALPNR